MRVAALYDIHGNLPALEAVLADVDREGVDLIVVGGDVLPGPMPRETIECLRGLRTPVEFIRGNGESAVLSHLGGHGLAMLPERAREAVQWVAEELQAADASLIAGWPLTFRLAMEGPGDILFCHATPRNDTEIFTRDTAESVLEPIFRGLGAALLVCGHTHMQFDRMVGDTRIVNAGSVGMPFGEPGAWWLLLDPDVVLRQTAYDLPGAAARIRSTSYPGADDLAERNILRAPSEVEMLALYAGFELR